MINMQVLDYRITSDSNQITVMKARRDAKGNIATVDDKNGVEKESAGLVGYYRNLTMALRGIQRDYLLSDGVEIKTISDYKNSLDTITRLMEERLDLEESF